MGDPEEAGKMMGKYGAAFGKGAAKYGKKAAQSEAGKRATSAAVKGACDGVRDDMLSRYGSEPSTPSAPEAPTSPPPTATTAEKSEKKVSTSSRKHGDSDDDESGELNSYVASMYQSSVSGPPARRPPKPSFFNRLKFTRKSPTKTSRPRYHGNQGERIYKSRLAREADWDRLPLAQTLYNFKGEMKCDLEFRKGQVIQVITRTETQNDWWEGKLEGRVGIFPANYVKLM